MSRDIEKPTLNDNDEQQHPGWGMISASRVTSNPGSVLFDSDIRHHHSVIVTIGTAVRSRQLNRDWMRRKQDFVEVEMSEAQWASFVSSMNAGDGVPCTIRRREGRYDVPGFPYEPRLQESMDEVHNAANKYTEKVNKAFEMYCGHKSAANLRTLKFAIENMPSNMAYAASSLTEHAENVVQRARADIEAMVISKAKQLKLDPSELGITPAQLTAPDQSEE